MEHLATCWSLALVLLPLARTALCSDVIIQDRQDVLFPCTAQPSFVSSNTSLSSGNRIWQGGYAGCAYRNALAAHLCTATSNQHLQRKPSEKQQHTSSSEYSVGLALSIQQSNICLAPCATCLSKLSKGGCSQWCGSSSAPCTSRDVASLDHTVCDLTPKHPHLNKKLVVNGEQNSLWASFASVSAATGRSAFAECSTVLMTTSVLAATMVIFLVYLHWQSADMKAIDPAAAEVGMLMYMLSNTGTCSTSSPQNMSQPSFTLQQLYQQAVRLKTACADQSPAGILHAARAAKAAKVKCSCAESSVDSGLVPGSSKQAGKVQGKMQGGLSYQGAGVSLAPTADVRSSSCVQTVCNGSAPAASAAARPPAAAGIAGEGSAMSPSVTVGRIPLNSSVVVTSAPEFTSARGEGSCKSPGSGGVGSFNTDDEEYEGCTSTGLQGLQLGLLLGAGSFGRVYQGDLNGQVVAVKVLEVLQQRDLQQVCYEVAINQMLEHPNIVRCLAHKLEPQDVTSSCSLVVDANRSQPMELQQRAADKPFAAWKQALLVMEYCDRGNLHDAVMGGLLRSNIGAGSCFNDMACVLQMALDVARGMAYMHSQNICHGDLCIKNVMLISSASSLPLGLVAKIADFGVSRKVPESSSYVQTSMQGTLTHMAPEVLLYQQMSLAADVYSFGILLWELLHLGLALGDTSSHGRITVAIPAIEEHFGDLDFIQLTDTDRHEPHSLMDPFQQQAAVPAACGLASGMCSEAREDAIIAVHSSTSTAACDGMQGLQQDGAVCMRVYQHLGVASPWAIMQHVIEGGRPVFSAPAVPGPYIALAQRCWHQQPQLRPPFSEIVELLEHVLIQDHHSIVESW